MLQMPNLIDLTGKIFKDWKVISKAESRNGKVYWLCKCQKCGIEKEIQGCHLKNEKVGKCSCENNNFLPEKVCVICGKKFQPKLKAYTRKYCYDCSPSGDISRAAAITTIRHSIKKQLVKYKGGKCERCGYNKCIGALQFHHKDTKEKDFELSSKYNGGNFDISQMYKEVDKCELLCANCHAEEHFVK